MKELTQLTEWRGLPLSIRVDNGPGSLHTLKEWCEDPARSIEADLHSKGKPSQNGYIERLNKTFREDILDSYQFGDVNQAQKFAHEWMWMYNSEDPRIPQTIYLSEDFSAGSLPSGWTVFNQQSPCIGWEFGDSLESAGFPILPHGMYAAVNDNRYDNAAGTANLANWCYLYSPIIDCSVADSLRLEFDYFIPPDIDGRANVALSNGGIQLLLQHQRTERLEPFSLEHPACLLHG